MVFLHSNGKFIIIIFNHYYLHLQMLLLFFFFLQKTFSFFHASHEWKELRTAVGAIIILNAIIKITK